MGYRVPKSEDWIDNRIFRSFVLRPNNYTKRHTYVIKYFKI